MNFLGQTSGIETQQNEKVFLPKRSHIVSKEWMKPLDHELGAEENLTESCSNSSLSRPNHQPVTGGTLGRSFHVPGTMANPCVVIEGPCEFNQVTDLVKHISN